MDHTIGLYTHQEGINTEIGHTDIQIADIITDLGASHYWSCVEMCVTYSMHDLQLQATVCRIIVLKDKREKCDIY